jgi:RHS repeat-associated protein
VCVAAFLAVGCVSAWGWEPISKAEEEALAKDAIYVVRYHEPYWTGPHIFPWCKGFECFNEPEILVAAGEYYYTSYEGSIPVAYYHSCEKPPHEAVRCEGSPIVLPGFTLVTHRVHPSTFFGVETTREVTWAYRPFKERRESEGFGPGNPGAPNKNECSIGDPVNCATGNEMQTQTDLMVSGRGPSLGLGLSYNSRLAAKQSVAGPFGFGWTGSYSAHLELADEGQEAAVYQDNGSSVSFMRSNASWSAPSGLVQATLSDEGSGYVYTLPDQTKLRFNESGVLTSEEDRNGNAVTLAYNAKERLESVTDSVGRKLTFKYNESGEVESVKDPMGHTVQYDYESGDLTSVILPGEEKASWKYKYNAEHELTSVTDGSGHATTFEYDEKHRVISETDAMSHKRTWEYATTELGAKTTITEPNGAITVEYFNEYGSPKSVTHAAGTPIEATTTYTYNTGDELMSVTDPDEHKTEYGYDSEGNRISKKDADGNETKWTYDATNDIDSTTTPNGETTTIKRDAHGNPEAIERPAPGSTVQKTTYTYDSHGDLTSVTDPLERTTKYEYDAAGDRISETNPEGDKRTWTYNEDSQETSTVSPRGNVAGGEPSKYTTSFERDPQGRVLAVIGPEGTTEVARANITEYAYDADGNRASVTDPNGNRTTYTYDADNEPIKVEAPNGSITETMYDSAGRVTSQTDGSKHTTEYVRNQLGEVTEAIDPLGNKTTKKYDLDGNLTSLTDPEKRTATYTYDPANRLVEVKYSDGKTPTVKYEYDKNGNRTVMTDGTGTTTYTYDQLDRLTEAKDGHGNTTKYEYDLDNEQTKITYPGSKSIIRVYNNGGRLEKITDWLEHTTKFTYDPDGELTATIFPSETTDEDKYAYDDPDQMNEVKMLKGTETLASLVYARDGDGQVKTTTSKGLPGAESTEYAYDTNNRLTKAGSTTYEYDAANNPTTLASATYKYNNASQLETGPSLTYTYDELGERTKTTPSSGPATTYGYDEASNLTSVERPKEGEVPKIEDTYAYNGEGLQTSQTISGTTSYFAWDVSEGLPLILSDRTNSYIYGPKDMPIEQINNTTGEVLYLHHDQAGSTRLITGSTGKTEATFTYGPYGELTGSTGTATTPLGYDGQYTNSDTGLIYLRAREYDPKTAQFLTVDPLVGTTRAPYNYASDNPVDSGDPTGLCNANPFSESFWTEGNCVSESSLNPIKYYEEEVESYENGCGYLASVAHGLEGAVVGALDASGAGDEGAAAEGAEEGLEATAHGAEQLAERGFSGSDIALTKSGEVLTQSDGATVYVKEIASGRFNVIVEGQRGVVTALKNIPQGAVNRLAQNYGWH